MKKVKLNVGGQTVEAEVMSFVPEEEPWSVYRCEDGTKFKMKLVVSEVFKLPEKDPITGFPQLMVRSSNIISVEPSNMPLSKKEIQ